MKKCSEFENNAISHMTFVGAANLVGWAYHTCITNVAYAFSISCLLNNLKLML